MTTRNPIGVLALACALSSAAGCSYVRRNATTYRTDTVALVQESRQDVQACYASVLANDPTAAGDVTIRFFVGKRSGRIVDAKVVDEETTAAPAVGECVVHNIEGLKLADEDRRQANAVFVWRFSSLS